jgi:hypothetical protein
VFRFVDEWIFARQRDPQEAPAFEIAELGSPPMHDIAPRLSQTPGRWRRPAPALGEHTDAVLAEVGLDLAAIRRMRQEGAAQTAPTVATITDRCRLLRADDFGWEDERPAVVPAAARWRCQCMALRQFASNSVWICVMVESWPARSGSSTIGFSLHKAIHNLRRLSSTTRRSGSATTSIARSHSAALANGSTR